MQEPYDSDVQFKLRAGPDIDAEEPAITAQLEDLRLEKLTQRVTLITVLIPVLIIIVLAIAYFDIKSRMMKSEDTDLMEFQKLSADLESRFSSLSLRQAALEETLAKIATEHSQTASKTTSLGSQLVELEESLSQLQKNATSFVAQKEFQSSRETLLKQIHEVTQVVNKIVETVDKADHEIEAMTHAIKSQIENISTALSARDAQIDALQARVNQQIENQNKLDHSVTRLEKTKIAKPDLDLALRLESLKIEDSFSVRLQTLQTAINALEKKVGRLSSSRTPTEPSAKSSITASGSAKKAPSPPSATQTRGGTKTNGIEEQTIGR